MNPHARSSMTAAELAGGALDQARQAASAMAEGDGFEAGTLLLDGIMRLAQAVQVLADQLERLT